MHPQSGSRREHERRMWEIEDESLPWSDFMWHACLSQQYCPLSSAGQDQRDRLPNKIP